MSFRWTCAACGTRYWWFRKGCEPCRAKLRTRLMEDWEWLRAIYDGAVRTAQAARIERDGGVN